jgi:hypothetical protein
MSCSPLDPACFASGLILGGITHAVQDGIRWIVVNTATWWIQIPSPGLTAEPAITRVQAWLLPVTAAVAVAGVIGAGLRMAVTRRASPLLDATGGLLTLATATTLGVVIPAVLLKAGDAWSSWVLQASTGGHFAQRLALVLDLGNKAAAIIVVIFGIAAIIVSLVQAVLLLFRQLALVILAGVLPLAAAGAASPMTRPWIRKVSSWMLALICYKPAAAAVYATAFTLIGTGRSPRTVLMGFVALLLSVVMLPALMRFFTWATGTIAGPDGGGQLLGAAAVGAIAVGASRSGLGGGAGSAAQDQAAYLNGRLGPPPAGGPPAGPASPSGPVSPSGAAPAGSSSAAPGAAAGSAPAYSTTAGPAAGSAGGAATGAAEASAGSAAAATGAGTGAATGAAAAGAAAAGPAGAAVAAGVLAAQAAAQAAARAADGAIGPEGQR